VDRQAVIESISSRLGSRRLVWAGIRGDDAEPLADLPQLAGSFSIIGAYRRRTSIDSIAYEDLTGERVDLEVWDIDDHPNAPATTAFRHELLAQLGRPSVMLPYRSNRFLSAIAFTRRDRCVDLGMNAAFQQAFDHKPWVESAVAQLDIPVIPWEYVAEEERFIVDDLLARGPVILRPSRTSGGEGIALVDDRLQVDELWPRGPEAFASVSTYLRDTVPLNVGATVWDQGVTIHQPSVQLIGIPYCVTRRFGYCGNEFGAAADLPDAVVDQVEASTVAIGHWLHSHGYRGTFGVDYLVHDGLTLFMEVNPRFQGSSHAASQRAAEAGESCEYLDHIASRLQLPIRRQAPLRQRIQDRGELAHIVVHRVDNGRGPVDVQPLIDAIHDAARWCRTDIAVPTGVDVHPGAALVRFTVRDRVTDNGFRLLPPWDQIIEMWQSPSGGDVGARVRG
jgi:hypothetical protein